MRISATQGPFHVDLAVPKDLRLNAHQLEHRSCDPSHQFVLGDVVDALESAGLPDEIKDAVRETLEGGTGRATELSDNARVILEKRYLRQLLDQCDGSVRRAAEQAGINTVTFYRLLKKRGLKVEREVRGQD